MKIKKNSSMIIDLLLIIMYNLVIIKIIIKIIIIIIINNLPLNMITATSRHDNPFMFVRSVCIRWITS